VAEKKIEVTVGPGFFGLLTIVFIILKLTHMIAWSWWWVLCPLWGPWAFFLVVILAIFMATWPFHD
jgi:hypothetical protein